jgi:hypothetical protein
MDLIWRPSNCQTCASYIRPPMAHSGTLENSKKLVDISGKRSVPSRSYGLWDGGLTYCNTFIESSCKLLHQNYITFYMSEWRPLPKSVHPIRSVLRTSACTCDSTVLNECLYMWQYCTERVPVHVTVLYWTSACTCGSTILNVYSLLCKEQNACQR